MFRLFKLFTLVLAVSTVTSAVPAAHADDLSDSYTWSPLEIGGGGWVTGMAVHPATPDLVYARTDVGGAYRWNSADETWRQMLIYGNVPNLATADYDVESIAVDPSDDRIVYLAAGNVRRAEGRVLKSTDQGRTWTDGGERWVVLGNGDGRMGGERLSVDPNDGDRVLFGTRQDGMWISDDGADSWVRVDSAEIPRDNLANRCQSDQKTNDFRLETGIRYVVHDPDTTGRVYAGVSGHGVYRSDDGGDTWRNIAPDMCEPLSAEIAPDGTLVTADHETQTLQRYSPDADRWTDISPKGSRNYVGLAIDPFNPNRMFAAADSVRDGAWYRTTDGGASWETLDIALASADVDWPLQSDLDGWMSVGDLVFDPHEPNKLWFAEGMGMWVTSDLDDDETTWNFVSEGIEELVTNDIVVPPGGNPVTAHWDRSMYYHPTPTNDAYDAELVQPRFSSTWDIAYSGGDPSFLVRTTADHRFCCEGDGRAYDSGYSTDGGRTWTRFASYDSGTHPPDLRFGNIAVAANDVDNVVWLPTFSKKMHVTFDRGATWTPITLPGTEPDNVSDGSHFSNFLNRRVLTADPILADTFYLNHQSLGTYRSTDGGATWTRLFDDMDIPKWATPYNAIMQNAPSAAGHLFLTTGLLDGDPRFPLQRSTDGGATWTALKGTSLVQSFGFGAPAPGSDFDTIYMWGDVNEETALWRSTDYGASWDKLSDAPLGIRQGIKAIDGDKEEFGRVYVGFSGVGFAVGEPGVSPTAVNLSDQQTAASLSPLLLLPFGVMLTALTVRQSRKGLLDD